MKLSALPLAATALLAAALIAVDTGAQDANGNKNTPTAAKSLATAQNDFGVKLMRELHRPGENTFFSATSITQAMQMALLAADGETRAEMIRAMGLEKLEHDKANRELLDAIGSRKGVTLNIANSIWGNEGRATVSSNFLTDAQKFYDAEARTINFTDPECVDLINAWVSGKTNAKITQLLDKLPTDAVACIVNAVYFKGTWATEFDKKETRDGDFTLDNGTKLKLPMMRMTKDLSYGHDNDIQFVRLGFKGDANVVMWFALPAAGKLDELISKFDGSMLDTWRKRVSIEELILELPRFKLAYSAGLVGPMQQLGIKRAFEAGRAEFPKLGNACISSIVHKAILEVNEEGAEAAAATAIIMKPTSANREPLRMIVNRPFFVAIVDEGTGAILFQGAVHKPEALAAK